MACAVVGEGVAAGGVADCAGAVGGRLGRGATNGSGVAVGDRPQPLSRVETTPRPARRMKRRRVSVVIGVG